MSSYKAISAVSSILQSLLSEHMSESVQVTLAPPDIALTGLDQNKGRVNLYLYRVTENAHLKNQEPPGNGLRGAYGHPPLSLNLHFLMTTHGNSETQQAADQKAQLLLGDAMRIFHDHAFLPEEYLTSELGDEFEHVKLTLQPTTLEDLSKIWSVFTNMGFRRCVSYNVSVVQIESQRERAYARLVGEPETGGPRVLAVPSSPPRIQSVRVIRQEDATRTERIAPHVGIGDVLVLRGQHLAEHSTTILLDGSTPAQNVSFAEDGRVEVPIPDVDALRPGPIAVQARNHVELSPGDERSLLDSNRVFAQLVPRIAAIQKVGGNVRITGSRLISRTGRGVTLLADEVVVQSAYIDPADQAIQVPIAEGLTGKATVRVRVDGVESIDSPEVDVT